MTDPDVLVARALERLAKRAGTEAQREADERARQVIEAAAREALMRAR